MKPSAQSGGSKTRQKTLVGDKAQKPVVDTDYQFRLVAPDQTWRVMDEEEFGQFMPDAAAGATSGAGVYGAIIVERIGDGDLDDYAALIRDSTDSLTGATGQMSELEDLKYNGLPAKKFTTEADVAGLHIFYQHRLLIRQGFGYQFVTWSTKDSPAEFEKFYSLVTLLDGPIKQRAIDTTVADYDAPGQRIRHGDFASPVYGVTYKSVPQWKTLVGAELAKISPDAVVGFQSARGSSYGIVIAEFMKVDDFEAFREKMTQSFGESTDSQLVAGEPDELQLFGKTISVSHFRTSTLPTFDYFFGIAGINQEADNPMVLQIQLWSAGSEDGAFPKLKQGASGLGLVPPEELKRLQAEYLSLPDPQNSVGVDFSLRRGVFRHFSSGTVWTKPTTGIWEIHVGDAADEQVPLSILYAEETLSGINIAFVVATLEDDLTDQQYHEALQSAYGIPTGVEESMTVDGTDCVSSVLERPQAIEDLDYETKVISSVDGRIAKQIFVAGPKSVLQKNKPMIAEIVNGFAFNPSETQMTTMKGNRFQDLRLGFEFSLPEKGWKGQDSAPPQIRALASMRRFTKGRKDITAGAITTPYGNDKATQMVSQILNNVLRLNLGKEFESTTPMKSEIMISGIPAKEIVWRSKRLTAAAITATRDSTVVFAIGFDESGDSTIIRDIRNGLKLLE